MSEQLVSIVVPTYNSIETLDEALLSARSQTHEPLDIVVVDDGSTDDSWSFLERLAAADPRVRVFRQPNAGAGAARNRGVQEARGDYVLFQDSDVILNLTMVERMVDALSERPDAAYAYCDFVTRSEGVSWRPEILKAVDFDPAALRRYNYVAAISMVRRELCPEWDASLKALEDWDLWLTLLDRGFYGVHIPAILFETIDREQSITQTWDRNHHTEVRTAVLAKHQRVVVVSIVPNAGQLSDTFVSSVEETAGAPFEHLLVSEEAVSRVVALNDALDAVGKAFDFVAVLDSGSVDLADGWLRDALAVAVYGVGRIVVSLPERSAAPWHTRAGRPRRARVMGRPFMVAERCGTSFVAPYGLLDGFRFPTGEGEDPTRAFATHALRKGAVLGEIVSD